MIRLESVESLGRYKLRLKYNDGTEGEVDLSDFAGRGVFSYWDAETFDQVGLDESGAVTWNDEIDLCPDMLYMRLTGKTPEEVFPNLNRISQDA